MKTTNGLYYTTKIDAKAGVGSDSLGSSGTHLHGCLSVRLANNEKWSTKCAQHGPVPFKSTLYDGNDDWPICDMVTQFKDDIAMLQCVRHGHSAACVCVGPLIQRILVCQLKGAPGLDILARLVQLVGVAGRQSTLQLHQNFSYVHILGGWRLLTLSMLSLRQTVRRA